MSVGVSPLRRSVQTDANKHRGQSIVGETKEGADEQKIIQVNHFCCLLGGTGCQSCSNHFDGSRVPRSRVGCVCCQDNDSRRCAARKQSDPLLLCCLTFVVDFFTLLTRNAKLNLNGSQIKFPGPHPNKYGKWNSCN